mmetsp:Transcript_17864/g.50870  ORF Transcript_17864/g.50870 Transcript_17864/m.50870 type:complete len:102 (-) Transcript_17864:262-567(-)
MILDIDGARPLARIATSDGGRPDSEPTPSASDAEAAGLDGRLADRGVRLGGGEDTGREGDDLLSSCHSSPGALCLQTFRSGPACNVSIRGKKAQREGSALA